jgi:hypothetical protein
MGQLRAGFALMAVLLVASCGSADVASKPGPPSTPGEIAAVKHASYDFPVYWFGPSFRGHKLRNAGRGKGYVTFTYGEPSCDPGSGCTDPYVVQTSLHREPATDTTMEDTCWSPVGKAWLLGCDGFEEGQLYTDRVEVYVDSGDADPPAMARQLKALQSTTPVFRAPTPLPCAVVRKMPARFRKRLPQPLRPHCP